MPICAVQDEIRDEKGQFNPREQVWQSQQHSPWPADSVVFLNDVYFCASGVLRLLHHDADLACGLDFNGHDNNAPIFYDAWVARDANGSLLDWLPPYFRYVTARD